MGAFTAVGMEGSGWFLDVSGNADSIHDALDVGSKRRRSQG